MIDLLQLAIDARLADLCVALPGRVESYDASAQTADVKPMVRRLVPTPDEDSIAEELPTIFAVPVCHPGGNGWGLHIPLAAGDTVLLVFQQWDPTEWQRTGEISDPPDQRRHSLAHAVAIPGYRAKQAALSGASSSDVTFTKDGFGITIKSDAVEIGGSLTVKSDRVEVGGTSDAAALATKVDALIAAFDSHTHITTATVGPGPAVGTIAPTVSPVGGTSASQALKLGS